jgi:hypothetical protein
MSLRALSDTEYLSFFHSPLNAKQHLLDSSQLKWSAVVNFALFLVETVAGGHLNMGINSMDFESMKRPSCSSPAGQRHLQREKSLESKGDNQPSHSNERFSRNSRDIDKTRHGNKRGNSNNKVSEPYNLVGNTILLPVISLLG